MKKKLWALILSLGMLTAGRVPQNGFPATALAEADGSADVPQPALEQPASADFSLADLENKEFYFSSGAGGWRTVLHIQADGRFSGSFSDSEMGSVGEGYPKGTYYLCEFEGAFTEPVPVNDYVWSMRIAEIRCAKEPGTTEIIDEILYASSTPYGLEGAEEILIYLPGAPTSELPEEYMNWVRGHMAESDASELPFYGLYNPAEQNGFSSYDLLGQLNEQLAFLREQIDAINASLENDPLTQLDMNLKSGELYELWNRALNAILSVMQTALPEEELTALTEEQQAWSAERDRLVEEAVKEVQGASIYPLIVNSEAARLTEERVCELYERLK